MGAKCYVVLPARRSKRSVVTPFPLCMRVPFSLFCHQRFGNDREMEEILQSNSIFTYGLSVRLSAKDALATA